MFRLVGLSEQKLEVESLNPTILAHNGLEWDVAEFPDSPLLGSQTMSTLAQVNCPSCSSVLRFPKRDVTVAVTCPRCQHLFEIQPSQDNKTSASNPQASTTTPVVAKPIAKAPIVRVAGTNDAPKAPSKDQPVQVRPISSSTTHAPSRNQDTPIRVTPHASPVVVPPVAAVQPNVHDPYAADPLSYVPDQPSAGNDFYASPSPTVRLRPKKITKPRSWVIPAVIAGSLATMLLFVGLGLVLVKFGGLVNGLGSGTSSAQGILRQYQSDVEKYVSAIEEIDGPDTHKMAAMHLTRIDDRCRPLIKSAAVLEPLDFGEHHGIIEVLRPLQDERKKVEIKVASLLAMLPYHDTLAHSLRLTQRSLDALEKQLQFGIAKIDPPNDRSLEKRYEALMLERSISLMFCEFDDINHGKLLAARLQPKLDDWNDITDSIIEGAPASGSAPREFADLEMAMEALRDWVIVPKENTTQLCDEMMYTLADLRRVEKRYDAALFKTPTEPLTGTSSSRVAAMMQAGTSEPLATSQPAPRKSDPISKVPADSGFSTNVLAGPSSPFEDGDSKTSVASDSQGRGLSEFSAGGSQDGFGRDSGSVPGAAAPSSPNSGTVSSSAQENILKGSGVVVIRLFGRSTQSGESIKEQLAKQLRASRSTYSQLSDDEAVFSFTFPGPLTEVAPYISFGNIEISDSQSRTIYVEAK